LPADVKIAVALLVACVQDLVKNAGREFARYSGMFNPPVVVDNQEVAEYETKLQAQLFDRVRASVNDVVGRMGGLTERLRSLGTFTFYITL